MALADCGFATNFQGGDPLAGTSKVDEETTDKSWPWFEVYEGENRYEVVGPVTAESFSLVKFGKRAGLLRGKTTYTNHSARWQICDGLSPREHAEVMHGINTAGLTDAQIAVMRDRDHDTYGRTSRGEWSG